MTGFIGAILEAWSEFRVHKARVLLSLVGVGIAVCALTAVTGLGGVVTQAQIESFERGGGRPATLLIMPPFNPTTGEQAPADDLRAAVEAIVDRYSITYSGEVSYGQAAAQLPTGVISLQLTAVDADYGQMHRIQLAEGRWFVDDDVERLAPAVIVNEALWAMLGDPDLRTNPTVQLLGAQELTGVVVGVTPSQGEWDTTPTAFLLNEAYEALAPPSPEWGASPPQIELWVPPEMADDLQYRITNDLVAAFGDDWDASHSIQRQDYLAWSAGDPLEPLKLGLSGVAILILLLGALGLVNISMVTVKQRIREIGIRRAFGATAGRVFLAVMLESVLATVVAGVVGVTIAVLIVQNPLLLGLVAPGLTDVPPFPVEAAITGLVAATAVGALAGLLPALVAVRVKVIDAIRA